MPNPLLKLLLCWSLAVVLPAQQGEADENQLRARAYAAEAQGRFAEAADAFVALSRAAPDRVDWVIAAGRCLGQSGRFTDALDLLQDAEQRMPAAFDVKAMLARTLLLRAEHDPGIVGVEVMWADAADYAQRVLEGQPDHLDARLILAQARYLLGDTEEAVRQAREAATRHPRHAGSQVLLGRIAADRFTALLAQLERERPVDRARAELVAEIDAARRDAWAAYRKATELDPARAHPHVAMSQLAWADGKRDEARAHLLDALAIDPDTATDHALLTDGLTWQERRDVYRALRKRYEATTSPLPTKAATLWFYEGRASYDGSDWEAARICFRQVSRHNPAATNAHYYAFICSYYLGDHDDAEQAAAAFAAAGAAAFADVLRALPAEQRAQVAAMVQFLGHRAFQLQRIDRSRDLNHVIACLKDTADAWNNHAFLCRETGRFEQALTSYQYAIEREPESPQLWNDMGVVLQYHLTSPENLAKAREIYEKTLRLADAVLAAEDSSADARQAAQEARANATANLAELPKQD